MFLGIHLNYNEKSTFKLIGDLVQVICNNGHFVNQSMCIFMARDQGFLDIKKKFQSCSMVNAHRCEFFSHVPMLTFVSVKIFQSYSNHN